MNKYDNMIEKNRKVSEEKIARAKSAIREMIEEEEKVTIPKLMKKTGLSRGFFYKNPVAQKEMDRALDLQAGMAPVFWGVRGFGGRVHITQMCMPLKPVFSRHEGDGVQIKKCKPLI